MSVNLTKKPVQLTLTNGNYHLRKFRILEILDKLPTKENRKFKKELPDFLEVSRQTFANWCNAPQGSTIDIPFSKAYRIALVLGCPVLDLLSKNYQQKTHNHPIAPKHSNIAEITGLTQ